MRAFRKFITSYWLWLVIGCVLQAWAIKAAYIERGAVRYGGEWLVLPVILLMVCQVRSFINEFCDIAEKWEVEDFGRNSRHHRRVSGARHRARSRRG